MTMNNPLSCAAEFIIWCARIPQPLNQILDIIRRDDRNGLWRKYLSYHVASWLLDLSENTRRSKAMAFLQRPGLADEMERVLRSGELRVLNAYLGLWVQKNIQADLRVTPLCAVSSKRMMHEPQCHYRSVTLESRVYSVFFKDDEEKYHKALRIDLNATLDALEAFGFEAHTHHAQFPFAPRDEILSRRNGKSTIHAQRRDR